MSGPDRGKRRVIFPQLLIEKGTLEDSGQRAETEQWCNECNSSCAHKLLRDKKRTAEKVHVFSFSY